MSGCGIEGAQLYLAVPIGSALLARSAMGKRACMRARIDILGDEQHDSADKIIAVRNLCELQFL